MATVLWVSIGVALLVLALSTKRQDRGPRALITANGVVLLMFFTYAFVSGAVPLFNGGRYFWAVGYERGNGLAASLLMFLIGILVYTFTYALMRSGTGAKAADVSARAVPLPPPASERAFSNDAPERASHRAVRLAWVLVACGLALKFAVVGLTGGLGASVAGASAGARDSLGLDVVSAGVTIGRSLSTIADGAVAWLLVEAMRRRERRGVIALIFVVVLALSFVMVGKRLSLLWPLLAVGVAFSAHIKPIRMVHALYVLPMALMLGMVTLFFRIFVPARIAGITVNLDYVPYAKGNVFAFYFNSLEFSAVEMCSVAFHSSDSILQMVGSPGSAFMRTFLEPSLYALPRFVWPGKPTEFLDMSYAISATLLGGSPTDADVGYAVTYVGVAYILGAWVGVVLASTLLGVLCGWIDNNRLRWTHTSTGMMWYALLLVLVFHLFRQGSLGWALIIGVVQQYGFLFALVLLTLAARPRTLSKSNETERLNA